MFATLWFFRQILKNRKPHRRPILVNRKTYENNTIHLTSYEFLLTICFYFAQSLFLNCFPPLRLQREQAVKRGTCICWTMCHLCITYRYNTTLEPHMSYTAFGQGTSDLVTLSKTYKRKEAIYIYIYIYILHVLNLRSPIKVFLICWVWQLRCSKFDKSYV